MTCLAEVACKRIAYLGALAFVIHDDFQFVFAVSRTLQSLIIQQKS